MFFERGIPKKNKINPGTHIYTFSHLNVLTALWHRRDVVVHELGELHEHVRVSLVLPPRPVERRVEGGGDGAGVGKAGGVPRLQGVGGAAGEEQAWVKITRYSDSSNGSRKKCSADCGRNSGKSNRKKALMKEKQKFRQRQQWWKYESNSFCCSIRSVSSPATIKGGK